jgi:hypothetical protein
MWAKAIFAMLIFAALQSTNLAAGEPVFVDPDNINFKFTFNESSSNKFCDLTLVAVKVPQTISFNAVAWRRGGGDRSMIFGYEIKAFESKIVYGIPSVPQALKILDTGVKSDIFSSQGSVDRVVKAEGALYTIKEAALSNFTGTVIRGYYYINVALSDRRNFTYVIRDDATLLAAAADWLKCTIRIAG